MGSIKDDDLHIKRAFSFHTSVYFIYIKFDLKWQCLSIDSFFVYSEVPITNWSVTMESSLCVVCNQRASFFCSICRTVWYCSKLHQKSHWKVHKPNCPGKAYQIAEDANTGHHLVASKDLEAGSKI